MPFPNVCPMGSIKTNDLRQFLRPGETFPTAQPTWPTEPPSSSGVEVDVDVDVRLRLGKCVLLHSIAKSHSIAGGEAGEEAGQEVGDSSGSV